MAKMKYAFKLNANFDDFGIAFKTKYKRQSLYRTLCPCGFHGPNFGYIICPECGRTIKNLNDTEETVNMGYTEYSDGFVVYLEFFRYEIHEEEVEVKYEKVNLFSYRNSTLKLLAPEIYYCKKDLKNRFFINAPLDNHFYDLIESYIPGFNACLKYVYTANIPYMFYYVIYMLIYGSDIYNPKFFADNYENISAMFVKMWVETDVDWQEEIKTNNKLFS